MTKDEKLDKFIEEGRAFFNELSERGCSESYMNSLFFGYYHTRMNDVLGIDYEVSVLNPETKECTTMTKEQFQKYLDEIGEDAYSHVAAIEQ